MISEKEAQQRSFTKAIGRVLNPMEWIRQISSGKYRRMISEIDVIDNIMRNSIARIKPDLRERLHQARMAFKNREYRRVFQYASDILDGVNGVLIDQMEELENVSREIYDEFSKDTVDDYQRQKIDKQLGLPKTQVAASIQSERIIEAGIGQWLQEKIPTKKEIEGTLFDKIFRNMQGKQQEAARQALVVAERTYDLIQQAFDALDNNRRNIVEYIRLAKYYQNKLSVENEHLRRMYFNYFSPETPQVDQSQTPVAESIQPINQPKTTDEGVK